MQPDLERLLRESRSVLPEPDPAARRRGIGVVLARIDPGRGRRRVGLFSAAIVALIAASLAVAAERLVRVGTDAAPTQRARVVDRTMLCEATLSGGITQIEIRTEAGAAKQGSTWREPAMAMVTTGFVASSAEALDNALAWAVGGRPAHDASVIHTPSGYTYPIRTWGTLAMTNRCRVSRARPALSRSGLGGGRVDWLGENFDCTSSRRVRVRVRAVLTEPAPLATRRGYRATTTPLREARVVVSTTAGRRLAYAEVSASGRARLFTSPDCVSD
jgi:hypothetical protein